MINRIKPEFTIIMPVFNLEDTLVRSISSVLVQSFQDFELIIVNDGSTDSSIDVINELVMNDSRVVVISKENGGVSSARNLGLERAIGKYVLFLDGDDTMDINVLKYASQCFADSSIDLFCYGFSYHTEDGKLIQSYSSKKVSEIFSKDNEMLVLLFEKKVRISVCSLIVNMNIISDNSLRFDIRTRSAEDIEFLISLLYYSKEQYYIAEDYLQYYHRKGSATNSKIENRNYDVYWRINKLLVGDKSYSSFEQYLCYWFVYEYINILKNGGDMKTIYNFLSMEKVLDKYKFELSKFSIATLMFKVFYKNIFRKILTSKIVNKKGNI